MAAAEAAAPRTEAAYGVPKAERLDQPAVPGGVQEAERLDQPAVPEAAPKVPATTVGSSTRGGGHSGRSSPYGGGHSGSSSPYGGSGVPKAKRLHQPAVPEAAPDVPATTVGSSTRGGGRGGSSSPYDGSGKAAPAGCP
ncbi:uncharacterized protein LOC110181961 [Drosophila serrata]|uniref:uncharacterized protein LOC110181961 n=1 Tax=Drosophila serrata TaxID=7274 RepID=UPI000A1D128E|nr:uncharacterized protein LOC110181961 [Drosophila serrata]